MRMRHIMACGRPTTMNSSKRTLIDELATRSCHNMCRAPSRRTASGRMSHHVGRHSPRPK